MSCDDSQCGACEVADLVLFKDSTSPDLVNRPVFVMWESNKRAVLSIFQQMTGGRKQGGPTRDFWEHDLFRALDRNTRQRKVGDAWGERGSVAEEDKERRICAPNASWRSPCNQEHDFMSTTTRNTNLMTPRNMTSFQRIYRTKSTPGTSFLAGAGLKKPPKKKPRNKIKHKSQICTRRHSHWGYYPM